MKKTKAPPTPIVTITQYLLDSLYKHGVEHIFGVPGDYVLRVDKCIEEHDIQYINATRENTAGYMADAYARLRGLGVACITFGVGINIVNALAQAFVESSPLIVISGAPSSVQLLGNIHLHHTMYKMPLTDSGSMTQRMIFEHVTIGQAVLNDPAIAQMEIDRIIHLCLKTKKPVYIEIPEDMVDVPLPSFQRNGLEVSKEPFYCSNPLAIHEMQQDMVAVLKKCRKPVLWLGHEILRYGLSSFVLKFAENHNIPIVSSLLGKTAISEYHPLFLGVYMGGMSSPEIAKVLQSRDCVLMLGLLLTDVDTGIFTAKLDYEHEIVINTNSLQIGYRQYREIDFVGMVSQLPAIKLQKKFEPISLKKRERKKLFKPVKNAKMTSKRLFECVQYHLKKEHIIVADVGDSLFGSIDLILDQNSFIANAHFGSLGFGVPCCIGAQLAIEKRRVIGLVGDGAFQMTCTELSTAIRYHIDPIIILLNNHGYGTERPLLEGAYNDIHGWNYVALPELIQGGIAYKVSTEEEFMVALGSAIAKRGIYHLIEVDLDKMDFSPALVRLGELSGKNKR